MNDLEKLFLSELKDIYDAEHQLVKALPGMVEYAESRELKDGINEHLEQTKNHINRLEQVFRAIGQEPDRKNCEGMEGIIDEGQTLAKEFKDNSALDAGLITAGQKVEHYEITSYGSLCTWAKQLGNNQALALLKENLGEEKAADEKLTHLAQEACNVEAMRHDTATRGEAKGLFSKVMGSGT